MDSFKIHIRRFAVLVLALQILNLSVQSRPATDTNDSFMLSHTYQINPVDHLLEFIMERIMHKKNAFPEDNKHQHRDPMQFAKTSPYNLYHASYYSIQIETPVHHILPTHRDAYAEGYNYLFVSEINPPPPKV